jgi:peptide/nickel transport system substrate-binding protein
MMANAVRLLMGSACGGALLLAAGAALPAVAADAPHRGGTVVVATSVDPGAVNPATSTSVPVQTPGCIIYEGLTKVSGEKITPLLAKSWTISPDGKTYDFKLVTANWHDGKPFTSADVKFSLTEVNAKITPSFSASAGRLLESVETPAPDEAVVHLSEPFGPLLRALACTHGGAILPEHIFKGTSVPDNPATTSTPIGTGPFKLAEWRRGAAMRLDRNADYWQPGKPYLDQVVIKTIPQPGARSQALRAGEIDYLPYFFVGANDIPTLRADPKLMLRESKVSPAEDILFFNVEHKPFDDKRVRHALLMATDRDYLVKNAWLNLGNPGIAPFTTQIAWAVNPDIDFRKSDPFDVEKANALLDEAGLKRGPDGMRFKANIVFPTDESDYQRVAVALKSMWKAVGVDLAVLAADRPVTEKRVFVDRDFDTHLNGYTSFGDPALGLARIYVSQAIGRPYGNTSGYFNPVVDDLFAKAQAGLTEAERGKIYQQVQVILAADLPVLTLREKKFFDVYTRAIQGLDDDAYVPTWADAWLKD